MSTSMTDDDAWIFRFLFLMQAVKGNNTAEVNSAALDARRRDTNLIKNVNRSGPAIEMPCLFSLFFFSPSLTGHCTNSFIVCTSFSIWYKPVSFYLSLETIDQLDYILNQWKMTWLHFVSKNLPLLKILWLLVWL